MDDRTDLDHGHHHSNMVEAWKAATVPMISVIGWSRLRPLFREGNFDHVSAGSTFRSTLSDHLQLGFALHDLCIPDIAAYLIYQLLYASRCRFHWMMTRC